MAGKIAALFNRLSEMVGLDNGIVDEEDQVVERNIESGPVQEKGFTNRETKNYSRNSAPIIEEDFDISSDRSGNLFMRKNTDEDKKAEEIKAEEKKESIERSMRRVSLATLMKDKKDEKREEKREEIKVETVENKKEEKRPAPVRESKDNSEKGEIRMANISDSMKINLCVARPTEFDIESCKEICSNLRAQRMVTINFEDVKSNDDKCRIYDFVCGCCVALDCKLEKVSREVYIATPYNAKVYKLDDKDQVQLTEDAYSFN
ncbi:MAG: cell division protein SepF [Clostridia bacterium]|nr:cell division protein SepF [Clostridia bacterium]